MSISALEVSDAELEVSDAEILTADPSVSAESTDRSGEAGFASLGLSAALVDSLTKSGYESPTPIQSQAIPLLLDGRDVIGQAQTGTGKTAAFALPMLERVDASDRKPQILVLVPTRELAIQVADAFKKYSQNHRALAVLPIFGGQDYNVQLRALHRGVHVVVGTPGRVIDLARRGALKIDALRCIVLDEADEMLRMGFAEDVEWVLTQAPENRQMALFSATMPRQIRDIAHRHLNNPSEIVIAQKTATADTVRQRYVVVAPRQKEEALTRILEAESTDGVLVFVKTRSATAPLAEYLAGAGWEDGCPEWRRAPETA